MIKGKGTTKRKSSGGVTKAKRADQISVSSKKVRRWVCSEAKTTLDSKNRVTLGKKVIDEIKKITHVNDISSFNVQVTIDGNVILQAMSTIPANEMWLWKNKKALASVQQGLKEAKEGKGEKLDTGSL